MIDQANIIHWCGKGKPWEENGLFKELWRPYDVRNVEVKKSDHTKNNPAKNDSVHFLVPFKELGSSIVRCNQVREQMAIHSDLSLGSILETNKVIERGHYHEKDESEVINELSDIKNSIVFCIWSYNSTYINKLKENNNILILDMIDGFMYDDKIMDHLDLFDAIIVNNKSMRNFILDSLDNPPPIYPIYHFWDPRLDGIPSYEHDELKLGYFGGVSSIEKNLEKAKYLFQSHKIEVIDSECGIRMTDLINADYEGALFYSKNHLIRNTENIKPEYFTLFNCHLSIRDHSTQEYKYKTNAKISTAAVLGHNIICSRDRTNTELLPADYPYFVDSAELVYIENAIKKAKDTFDTDTWYYGLECMRRLKERTSPARIISDYEMLCRDITAQKLLKENISNVQKETKNRIVLFTSNFGKYDEPNDVSTIPGIDFIYIGDYDHEFGQNSWEIIKSDLLHTDFVKSNRYLKIRALDFFGCYDIIIYVDANITVRSNGLLDFIQQELSESDFAAFEHPQRSCIYEELNELGVLKKASSTTLMEFKNYLLDNNFPTDFGLTWNAVLLRRNTEEVKRLCSQWWSDFIKAGLNRDQVTLMNNVFKRDFNMNIMPLRKPLSNDQKLSMIPDLDYGLLTNMNRFFVRKLGGRHIGKVKYKEDEENVLIYELNTGSAEVKGIVHPTPQTISATNLKLLVKALTSEPPSQVVRNVVKRIFK